MGLRRVAIVAFEPLTMAVPSDDPGHHPTTCSIRGSSTHWAEDA